MRDFKNLNIVQETQINAILDAEKEKSIRLKPIRDHLNKYYLIEEITEINNYQIAKVKNKNNPTEWLYSCYINYQPIHEMGMTFDQAVLMCLCYKYDNRRTDAEFYISRLINMKNDIEEIKE